METPSKPPRGRPARFRKEPAPLRKESAPRRGHPAAARDMRTVMRRISAPIIISALLGGIVGGAVVFISVRGPAASTRPPASAPNSPGEAAAPAGSNEVSAQSPWASPLATATQRVAAGRLREAQEEYLSILLIEPTHEEAMRGLVRVVGLIAKGDRTALRRQAEEYRRAVTLGVETEEHYTAPAMELLARASLQAAGVRRGALPPSPRPAPPPAPATPRVRPSPASRPEPATPPRSALPPARPQRPAPAPAPQAPPPSPPPAPPAPPAAVNVNEPFVTVVIGPFGSSDRASAITGELTIAGYAARLRREGAGSYVITLGPYRQSEAARAAGYVKSRFGQGVPVTLTPVR